MTELLAVGHGAEIHGVDGIEMSVSQMLAGKLPITALLTALAFLLIVVISIPLGMIDPSGIADAAWFDPENCPDSPPPGSIAYKLIHDLL